MTGRADDVAAYHRDGVVCLRGAFDPAWVERLRAAAERDLAEPGPHATNFAEGSTAGRFFGDMYMWKRDDDFRAAALDSPAPAIAAGLMRSATADFFYDQLFVKEPGTAHPTPWHQDLPYYNVAGQQNVSMWCPVDPVPRESTLEFVRGSHLGPWFMPRSFLDGQAKWFPEGSLAELPDVQPADVIGWALEPGDAVFFHMLTLHASGGVPGPGRRRVLSVRFLGDDMVHAVRPWRTSPPFPGLAEELPDGAPLDHPLFPVLWEAA